MSSLSEHHKRLVDGKGMCSVPMFRYPGIPAGFCDEPAYGERPEPKYYWRDRWTWERRRSDNKYDGYVPALACVGHGGPELKEVAHQGDPCKFCGTAHDNVAVGPCPEGLREFLASPEHAHNERMMRR